VSWKHLTFSKNSFLLFIYINMLFWLKV
jgi:hypothetical protein